jgi:hypothetical protein
MLPIQANDKTNVAHIVQVYLYPDIVLEMTSPFILSLLEVTKIYKLQVGILITVYKNDQKGLAKKRGMAIFSHHEAKLVLGNYSVGDKQLYLWTMYQGSAGLTTRSHSPD